MSYLFNNSGSTWIKCDLHVHTPNSVVQGYGGDTEEIWEKYIKDLESLPVDYKIIGINDYLFLDGYEKVLRFKESGRLKNIELILPVVEFRLDIFAGQKKLSKINYHVIFANEDLLPLESIKRSFLSQLIMKKTVGSTTTWEEPVLNKKDLIRFGKLFKENTPETKIPNKGDLLHGFENATHSLDKIEALLNTAVFSPNGRKLFFTAIGRAEWENMRWESAGADKKSIITNVDFVFTGCNTSEQYNRGLASLKSNGVNSKLLNFSDAHFFSSEDSRNDMRVGDSLTFLKCLPTFEGLRQLKHVFESRTLISESGVQEKKPYYVIDSVAFADNTGFNLFPPEPIMLNENLNTIIGGKSTGKSLLLNHIAKSIDFDEVAERSSSVTEYNHEKSDDFDFVVTWKDGEVDTLKGINSTNRKIVYISQSYIDELTSTDFEERIKFNDFVKSIILQDATAESLYNSAMIEVRDLLSSINSKIQKTFSLKKEIKDKGNSISEIGDETGVVNFIKQVGKEITELKSDGMSSEESKIYESLMSEVNSTRVYINNYNKDKEAIRSYYDLAKTNIKEIQNEYTKIHRELITDEVRGAFKSSNQWLPELVARYNLDIAKFNAQIKELLQKSEAKLKELDTKLEPLSNKSKQSTLLKDKMRTLSQEQTKLLSIQSEKIILNNLTDQFNQLIIDISDEYKEIETRYLLLATELKVYSDVSDELDISIQLRFNNEEFNTEIENNRANKPSLKKCFPKMINDDEAFEYIYGRDSHADNMKKFLTALTNGEIKMNQHGNASQLAKAIFDDKFYLNFVISYQNDTIDSMSPGKKNLVVLKLLIELNNSEYPILIDQPEDDLDNRSIYEDLVEFLKRKKSKRQIILVTHNPNVVVGTDSENSIVANQDGQTPGRINRKYKFEYCNGAIEHSFIDTKADGVLFAKGIKEHICDILEGGEKAFQEREARYDFEKKK